MHIDHVGIAVRSIEKGIELWETVFGYRQMTDVVVNTRQKVKVVFLKKDDSITIKLIAPADETSPIYSFSLKGGGLHHLCFKGERLEQDLDFLKRHGVRVIAQPQPGEAFENEQIAFGFVSGLNIELIDTDRRAMLRGEGSM